MGTATLGARVGARSFRTSGSRAGRAWARIVLALVVAAGFSAVPASPAAALDWAAQDGQAPGVWLDDIDCPSLVDCFIVGASGTIRHTYSSGNSWQKQTSGTDKRLSGVGCFDYRRCIAVGHSGTILATTNEGATWTAQTSPIPAGLNDVACATATTCTAVAWSGEIIHTTNGGSTWQAVSSPANAVLWSIACPSSTTCIAVGEEDWYHDGNGTVLLSTNGGATWSSRNSQTPNYLTGVSCPTAAICVAVGYSGAVVRTLDGGQTWQPQRAGGYEVLTGVSCKKNSGTCFAVAADSPQGGITTSNATKTDGNSTWQGESFGTTAWLTTIACPSATRCIAVGENGTVVRGADLTPPAPPSINSSPELVTTSKSATFTFSGEAAGHFECRLDTGYFEQCTSPKSYHNLSAGSHTFEVRQIDTVGNVGEPSSYTWVVAAL